LVLDFPRYTQWFGHSNIQNGSVCFIKTLPVGTNVVIDSTAEALQTKGLLIAKTLCVTNAEGLPLRMINVTDQPQTINGIRLGACFIAAAFPVFILCCITWVRPMSYLD
jgi:hypothetical protein